MATTTVHASNWMEGVDGTKPLSKLSIPGSHESCSRHGGSKTECQSLSITEQLNRGIRFLDIRCKYVSDDNASYFFPIHHYNYYQEIGFLDVQQECIDFLTAHPQETILMNVQQEHHYYSNDAHYLVPGDDFASKFADLVTTDSWSFRGSVPTLDEVRGRILLIRTYDRTDPGPGWNSTKLKEKMDEKGVPCEGGLKWNGFTQDGFSENLFFETQNGWSAWNGDEKGQKVQEHLDAAAAGTKSPDKIYLNFLSHAQGDDMKANASDMNQRISGYISGSLKDNSKRLGIVAMDYVGNTPDAVVVSNDPPGTGSLEDLVIQHNPFKLGCTYSFG